jgi:hypothetical protein
MLPTRDGYDGGHLVKSAIINKNSPFVDVLEMLSGAWNEYDSGEWHIVKTPLFLVMTATLDKGKHALPFTFKVPVAGTLCTSAGTTKAVIIKPSQTAIETDLPGIVTVQAFGNYADVKAVR